MYSVHHTSEQSVTIEIIAFYNKNNKANVCTTWNLSYSLTAFAVRAADRKKMIRTS